MVPDTLCVPADHRSCLAALPKPAGIVPMVSAMHFPCCYRFVVSGMRIDPGRISSAAWGAAAQSAVQSAAICLHVQHSADRAESEAGCAGRWGVSADSRSSVCYPAESGLLDFPTAAAINIAIS